MYGGVITKKSRASGAGYASKPGLMMSEGGRVREVVCA